jgi:hypothetical protein
MKKLPRILQIIWMLIAVVSIFQVFSIFNSDVEDKTSGYLFGLVALFALMRYFVLRRRQFLLKKKHGDFD